jgi:hypothetical protein
MGRRGDKEAVRGSQRQAELIIKKQTQAREMNEAGEAI